MFVVYFYPLNTVSLILPSVYSLLISALYLQSVYYCLLFTVSLFLPYVYSQFIIALFLQSGFL